MPLKNLPKRIANLRPGRTALGYALFGLLWVAIENRLFSPPAEHTTSALLAYLLPDISLVLLSATIIYLLLYHRPASAALPASPPVGQPLHRGYLLLLLVILLAVSPLITLGVKYFYLPRIEQDAYVNLQLVSRIKVVQFERWRDSRVGDAEVLAADRGFAASTAALLREDTPSHRAAIAQRFAALISAYEYESIALLDAQGNELLVQGRSVASNTIQRQLTAQSRSGKVVHSDLYTIGERVQLDIVAPIIKPAATGLASTIRDPSPDIVAYVIVHTGIDRQILPRVLSWPSSSSSARIVIARQADGQEALIHYHTGTPRKTTFTLRPLTASSPYASAKRTLGIDYRQREAYVNIEPIQGSAWRMVGQIDKSEVMAPLDTLLAWIASLTLIAVALLIGAILLLLRQQQRTHALELLTESSERDRLLKRFYDMPFIGMAVIDIESKRWTQVNERLCEMLGYEAHELLRMTWIDITHPEDLERDLELNQAFIDGKLDHILIEKRLLHRSGKSLIVRIEANAIRDLQGKIEHYLVAVEDITERRTAENALRQQEEFNRVLLNNQADGVVACDADMRLVVFNNIARQWHGLDPREIPPEQWSHYFGLYDASGEHELQAHEIPLVRAFNGEQLQHAGMVIKAQGQAPRFVSCSATAFFDDQGKKLGAVAIMRDITEIQAQDRALRESETLFQALARVAPAGIFRTNAMGANTYINRRGLEILGLTTEADALGSGWARHLHPDDTEPLLQAWKIAFSQRATFSAEYRFLHPDGKLIWVKGEAQVESDDKGTFLGYVGTITDITAIKQSEENLRMAAAVFDNTREGIMVTDQASRILSVNRAFSEITQYDAAEVIGKTPKLLQSGKHEAHFFEAMWQALNTEGYWQSEIWNRRKNGELYPQLLSISVIRDPLGAVQNYVGIFADITNLKASEARLDFLAHHDPLTNLPNRLRLISNLEHAIQVAQREQKQLALLMLDLDRFKDVNDTFGHLAGDELLQHAAKRLTRRLRGADTVARLGGDEFTILLEDINLVSDSAKVADSIIKALEAPCKLANNVEVHIGVSIGISIYPEHGSTALELLQHADAALYQAKAAGKGCYRYFSETLTKAARDRFSIESRLRAAIEKDQLALYYQPKIDIASGKIVGAEALIRWIDPVEGVIMPGSFISVAEETGMISRIGEWVIRTACAQGRHWLDQGLPPMAFSVNISANQLHHGDLYRTIRDILAETGFPATSLELELTESILMQREKEVLETLSQIRSAGVVIGIDDFGTGYSSLAYLKSFPLDVLKIDRGFVADIEYDADDRAITATIIAMAHTLGMQVVAEGVENEAQLTFLKTLQCDIYQGYLISKPLPADAFETFMREYGNRSGAV